MTAWLEDDEDGMQYAVDYREAAHSATRRPCLARIVEASSAVKYNRQARFARRSRAASGTSGIHLRGRK